MNSCSLIHCFSKLHSYGLAQWGRNSIPSLSVFVPNSSSKGVRIRESLGPGVFPYVDQPVLVQVQHLSLLAAWLGIRDGGLEDVIPGHPAVHFLPVVVPVRGVREEPGDEGFTLFVLVVVTAVLQAATANSSQESLLSGLAVAVLDFLSVLPILHHHLNVGQVSPITARICRDILDSGLIESIHFFTDVVNEGPSFRLSRP